MSKASKAQLGKHAKSRDKTGRFAPGASGNPSGRPRKRPAPAWSLVTSLALALAETLSVRGPDGLLQDITARDLMVKTLVHSSLKANPKDQLAMLAKFSSLGALDPYLTEPEHEDPYSEVDRRILELVQKSLPRDYCTSCAKEIDYLP